MNTQINIRLAKQPAKLSVFQTATGQMILALSRFGAQSLEIVVHFADTHEQREALGAELRGALAELSAMEAPTR